MKHRFRRYALILGLAAAGLGQAPPLPDTPSDVKLPNGKSQRDEILKAEHEQNLKDAAELVGLAQQLQQSLEKNDRFVLSLSDLKRTEDIEKLARKIRSRMQHN
jgi:hypothetical protein